MREDRELGRKDASVEGGSGGGYIVLNPVQSHDNYGSYSTPSEGSSLTVLMGSEVDNFPKL